MFDDSTGLVVEISEILTKYKQLESTKLFESDIELKLKIIEQSRVVFGGGLDKLNSLLSQESEVDEGEMIEIVEAWGNSLSTVILNTIRIQDVDYKYQQIDAIYLQILQGTSAKF